MGQQGTRWTPEQVAIALGVAGSMAGNVTYAVQKGSPILIGVGVGMSLVLPVAVRLWRSTPTPASGLRRMERALVMGGICLGAAIYSLVHIADVLHAAGLPLGIAWMPGAVMELLVVQAARATDPAEPAPPARAATPRKQPAAGRAVAPRPPSPPVKRPGGDGTRPVAGEPQRPQLVPTPGVEDETPEERRRRQEREKKRRQRARKAEQQSTTTEEGTG
ncbi:hypothetical protein [Pseudonocardia sp. NPDC049635]|uniref:hypothetical protein n=1 Tax=Pseudonocardia sp. NPDC049635 TaxID=3155506 RepID=UPI0033E95B49